MKNGWLVLAVMASTVGCREPAKPNYRWYKSPTGWMLDSVGQNGGKGSIAFDERTDHSTGLTAMGVPSGTEITIGAHKATFDQPNSTVMIDIRSAIGAAPLGVFDDQAVTDERAPVLSGISVTVRYPGSDAVFSTMLVAEIAKPLADSLLDKITTGPVTFADEIASDPVDTTLVVLDTNIDGQRERKVTVRGPGKTLANVDRIALVDHVAAGTRRCHGYSDGSGNGSTSLIMVFHATRIRLFDRRSGNQLGAITAKGKQTCPTEVTITGTSMEGLPVAWSGGDDIYLGGDEAFAWLDKRLATRTL
jgi:hypothetical protein